MNGQSASRVRSYFTLQASCGGLLLWLSQPPLGLWPLACVALTPWLHLAVNGWERIGDATARAVKANSTRRRVLVLWAVSFVYWLFTLQGLRHAHPVMYACWIALAGYLAIYLPLFIYLCRRMWSMGIPLWVSAPCVWVGLECIRNYLLTGISAVMLGHSVANVPLLIQIADLFGTYGVSFVLVSINVAVYQAFQLFRRECSPRVASAPIASATALLAATCFYGYMRDRQTTAISQDSGNELATFALIQRNEQVEYAQDIGRSVEMFQNYANDSVAAVRGADRQVDAVVWPESMFSGGAAWMMAEPDARVPPQLAMSPSELQANVVERQRLYLDRARYVQSAIAAAQRSSSPPQLIAGCGVVRYAEVPEVYSGVVQISEQGRVSDWYGKTHLVMFGEYVPLIPYLPGLRSLVPPEMGLQTGPGPQRFIVGETAVVPNICIETAVERVTINHVAQLLNRGESADVIVTVTNDGWFDDSSVIEHHLRCAQLVAVGCRRPILSAANNGPTAWIDSRGQLVQRLPRGSEGAIIATPRRDSRWTLYLTIGDWPARALAILCVGVLVWPVVRRNISRRKPNAKPS